MMMAKIWYVLFVGRGEGTEVGTTVGEVVGDGLMHAGTIGAGRN